MKIVISRTNHSFNNFGGDRWNHKGQLRMEQLLGTTVIMTDKENSVASNIGSNFYTLANGELR